MFTADPVTIKEMWQRLQPVLPAEVRQQRARERFSNYSDRYARIKVIETLELRR